MKLLIIVTLWIVMLSTITAAQCKLSPKLGAKIPAKCLPQEDDGQPRIAIAASDSRPFIQGIFRSVRYIVAYDEDTRRIKYIQTLDRVFRTANGLHVGSQIKVTQDQISGGCCGWYTFAGRTPDGWDIIIPNVDANDWKAGETRTVVIAGFKKSGK